MKYIAAVLAFVLLIFLVKEGYENTTKTGAKSVRLECHKKSTVFERVYDQALLKEAQHALKAGNYELSSSAQKAKYMQSRLFEHVGVKAVDQMIYDTIAAYRNVEGKANTAVTIDNIIYENDKGDPGKKTPKSKLYAGYLYFQVVVEGQKVYVIQIDFMDMEGKDLPERIKCAVKSIMTAS